MYPRLLQPPTDQSFFLFGPRGVGKTAWARQRFPDAPFFDLLDYPTYTQLLAAPQRLGDQIPAEYKGWVVVDEIQRVPELLKRWPASVPYPPKSLKIISASSKTC